MTTKLYGGHINIYNIYMSLETDARRVFHAEALIARSKNMERALLDSAAARSPGNSRAQFFSSKLATLTFAPVIRQISDILRTFFSQKNTLLQIK